MFICFEISREKNKCLLQVYNADQRWSRGLGVAASPSRGSAPSWGTSFKKGEGPHCRHWQLCQCDIATSHGEGFSCSDRRFIPTFQAFIPPWLVQGCRISWLMGAVANKVCQFPNGLQYRQVPRRGWVETHPASALGRTGAGSVSQPPPMEPSSTIASGCQW